MMTVFCRRVKRELVPEITEVSVGDLFISCPPRPAVFPSTYQVTRSNYLWECPQRTDEKIGHLIIHRPRNFHPNKGSGTSSSAKSQMILSLSLSLSLSLLISPSLAYTLHKPRTNARTHARTNTHICKYTRMHKFYLLASLSILSSKCPFARVP